MIVKGIMGNCYSKSVRLSGFIKVLAVAALGKRVRHKITYKPFLIV